MYDNIKKALCKELEQMDKDMENNSKMSDGDLRRFDTIMHSLKCDATWEAMEGQSYGIPTMQGGVETIRPYVDEFIQFAKEHPTLTFLVTRIGCGIAGFTVDEISPLFEKAHDVENIVLPPNW